MQLIEANKIFSEIKDKGYNIGLTNNDFYLLNNLKNSFDAEMVATDEDWYNLYEQIDNIISKIYNSGILHKYSEENCDYIQDNSYLLPLVLANNEHHRIKMYSDNSYMFLCQFHKEHTPSMGVSDLRNLLYCFGCGEGVNVISYIKRYEKLTFKQTIQLLAQIYLFDIKSYDRDLESLVKKYQQVILSQEYIELLRMGYDRLKKRCGTTYECINIDKKYEDRYKMIERIKEHQYDNNFQYEKPKKIMYLRK